MKVLIFEPFCGAAGDMVIGCLLSLGARLSFVKHVVDALSLGIELKVGSVERGGVSAVRVEVRCEGEDAKAEAGGRDYAEILRILESAARRGSIEQNIIESSLRVFERLAAAEARIHGVPKERVRFHELGAYDTIADVVGACAAFHDLVERDGIEKVLSTPVAVGGGFVEVYGAPRGRKLPVPAPATLEILRGGCLTLRGGPLEAELLTPTGAALLSEFVQETVRFLPEMRVEKVGYGAGAREFKAVPNVLRATMGMLEKSSDEAGDVGLLKDEVEVLETNVDDVTGEILGNLVEVLMREGALDVAVLPATMKKGRAGHVIKVLTKPEDAHRLARRIIEESGTLGVRIIPTKHRLIARRRLDTVKIRIHGEERAVTVKIAEDALGNVLNVSAEFEDAKKAAEELGVPVREVMRAAEEAARRRLGRG